MDGTRFWNTFFHFFFVSLFYYYFHQPLCMVLTTIRLLLVFLSLLLTVYGFMFYRILSGNIILFFLNRTRLLDDDSLQAQTHTNQQRLRWIKLHLSSPRFFRFVLLTFSCACHSRPLICVDHKWFSIANALLLIGIIIQLKIFEIVD